MDDPVWNPYWLNFTQICQGGILFFRFHIFNRGKTDRNAILHLSKPKVEYKWPKGSGSSSPAVMLTQHPQPLFFCTSYTEIHGWWKVLIHEKWFKLRAQWVGPNNLSESIVCLLQRPTLLEFNSWHYSPPPSDLILTSKLFLEQKNPQEFWLHS